MNTCKSVFKDGENKVSSQTLTAIWALLINQSERSKATLAGVK